MDVLLNGPVDGHQQPGQPLNLVTKVYFPREILPLTYVIAAARRFRGRVTSCSRALMVYYGVPLTTQALCTSIPIVAVLMVFAIAVSLVLSAIQVRYRDIGVAMPLLLQLWMFATPVVYPAERRSGSTGARSTCSTRWWASSRASGGCCCSDGPPDFARWPCRPLISFVLLTVAFVYFKHVEATVADVI